jgi:hypothetical protein
MAPAPSPRTLAVTDEDIEGHKCFPEVMRINLCLVCNPRGVGSVHEQSIWIVGQPLKIPEHRPL